MEGKHGRNQKANTQIELQIKTWNVVLWNVKKNLVDKKE